MAEFKRFKYANADEFKEDIAALSPEVPYADDLSPLGEKAAIGERHLANRLAVQPM